MLYAQQPLPQGPFHNLLLSLSKLQSVTNKVRISLVTARGAPAHKRVINTLRSWDIKLDQVVFTSGQDKSKILAAMQADIFFDDQKKWCDKAKNSVCAAHVPFGVTNQQEKSIKIISN